MDKIPAPTSELYESLILRLHDQAAHNATRIAEIQKDTTALRKEVDKLHVKKWDKPAVVHKIQQNFIVAVAAMIVGVTVGYAKEIIDYFKS